MEIYPRKGSALVLVIIIMSLVTILGTTLLYNATLLHTLAVQRIGSGQFYHAAHALLNYGIAQCKELDSIREHLSRAQKSEPKETTYTFENWFPASLGYAGLVTIKAVHDTYTVTMLVSKKGTNRTIKGGCHVEKGPEKWEVSNFFINQ